MKQFLRSLSPFHCTEEGQLSVTGENMSHIMRKPVLPCMQTTRAQTSLRIRAVRSAPLLFAA